MSDTFETRIRCTGLGKGHANHIYLPSKLGYLLKQVWTKEKGCRPYVTERRTVGPWVLDGQQELIGQQALEATDTPPP